MLDAQPAKLIKHGTIEISEREIKLTSFEGIGCTCREVVALGLVWAIAELTKELQATMQQPGNGKAFIGE